MGSWVVCVRWLRGLLVCGGFVVCLCALGSWVVCVPWLRWLFVGGGFLGSPLHHASWVVCVRWLRGLFACGGFVGQKRRGRLPSPLPSPLHRFIRDLVLEPRRTPPTAIHHRPPKASEEGEASFTASFIHRFIIKGLRGGGGFLHSPLPSFTAS